MDGREPVVRIEDVPVAAGELAGEGEQRVADEADRRHRSDSLEVEEAVSLAVQETLESLEIPGIRVKWPNDILSGGQKIGGILLENQFQGNRISRSIIGIGLNVNQTEFRDLPAASSLKRVMDIEYDLDALLACLLGSLREHLSRLPAASEAELLKAYEASLFQKDEAADYFGIGGVPFRGVIRGVHPDGRLKMEMEGGALEAFGFQELRFSL